MTLNFLRLVLVPAAVLLVVAEPAGAQASAPSDDRPASAPVGAPQDLDLAALVRALRAELGDSVVARFGGSRHPLPAQRAQVLALSFPARRFDVSDAAAMRTYLGRVVPRARRLAGAAADSLGLLVQLEMWVPPSPGASPETITRMSQDFRWSPGRWPADSAGVVAK